MEIICKKQIQKKNNLFFKQFNIFLLTFQTFIIFSFIKYINNNKLPSQTSKAIKLLNNNVLVVHETGIDIYDSFLNNSISKVVNYSSDSEVLTKFNFVRIYDTETEDNGIIIIIKKQNIYILNNFNGCLIYEEKNETILDANKYPCLYY